MIPTIHKGKLYASEYYKPEYGNALYVWESQLLKVDNKYRIYKNARKLGLLASLWINNESYIIDPVITIYTIEIEPTTKGHCKITEIKED